LREELNWNHRNFLRALAAFLTMGAFLFLAAAPRVRADDREHCRQRIEKAEARLNDAIAKHGERSREAVDRWHDLRAEREHCYTAYHQWWDGRDQKWHDDNGWNRDDRFPDDH
jgi:hypothetical protein